MIDKQLVVGMLEVNCYLVFSNDSKILYIIDPGSDAELIYEATKKYDYQKAVVLLTHAHVDHISGLSELVNLMKIEKVFLHQDDVRLYNSPNNHLMPYVPLAKNLPKVCNRFDEIKEITSSNDDILLIHTPGHTLGGCCFYFSKSNTLYSGDTLFANSVGRTDLPGGSHSKLINSIKTKLFALSDDVIVKPGHGAESTIGNEKKYNQYLGNN